MVWQFSYFDHYFLCKINRIYKLFNRQTLNLSKLLRRNMKEKLFGFEKNNCFEYENGFYITSHNTRISKIISHYELYKMILGLPGHIVECGVYKGTSLIRFAVFREMLESPYSRKIIGFDIFGKFPKSGDKDDIAFVEKFEDEGGEGMSKIELEKVLMHKNIANVELIQGNILESVPDYVNNHPEMKICLLYIDVDIYEPTKIILENLFEKVVKEGLIIFDDYATIAGETRAVDEFLKNKKIEKLPFSHTPCFFRKT